MKAPLISLLLVAGLAACSSGDDAVTTADAPAPAAPAATTDAPAATPAVRGPRGKPLAAPLPQGVVLDFPLHFRYDRAAQDARGTDVRRIKLEFLGGDVDTVAASITESMIAAGLKGGVVRSTDDGRRRLVFRKKDYGRVVVDLARAEGQKTRHPAAGGVVLMTWPGET